MPVTPTHWAIVDDRGIVKRGTELDIMTDWRRITLTQSFDDPGHRGDYYLVTVHAFSHEIKPKGKWILIDNNAHGMTPFTSLKKLRDYAREHQMQVKRSPTDPHCYYVTSWQYVPGNR